MFLSRIFLSLSIVFISLTGYAQDAGYPAPPKPSGHLFYLQHSRNHNTVMYSVNLKGGKPDSETPVNIYWIRYSEQGQQENLTTLQRNFAYGIQFRALDAKNYEMNFVSYKDYKMYLRPGPGGYHVYTTILNHPAILSRVYLEINGGGLLSPKIDYVRITGIDQGTGKEISQIMKIK